MLFDQLRLRRRLAESRDYSALKATALVHFIRSTRTRLALTYLSIIMLMSLGFSVVFYSTSSQQLARQLVPQSFYLEVLKPSGLKLSVDPFSFMNQRIREGRRVLLLRLILLNLLALGSGSLLSYLLARRTLAPIEQAMESQSQFVSDASHELRTPLTAIQTSNEVALRKPKLTLAQAKQIIRYNSEDVMKLKALSDGLLRLAHQDTPTKAAVHIQQAVTEALQHTRRATLAKKITIHGNELPATEVVANQQSLVQIIVILLDNAIKYSEAGSTISFHASTKGKFVFLSIRDTGIGIPAADLPHIFKRFYRADRSRSKHQHEGYGLGLSIADKLIRQQRGEILAASTPGKGSTFTIKLLRK